MTTQKNFKFDMNKVYEAELQHKEELKCLYEIAEESDRMLREISALNPEVLKLQKLFLAVQSWRNNSYNKRSNTDV